MSGNDAHTGLQPLHQGCNGVVRLIEVTAAGVVGDGNEGDVDVAQGGDSGLGEDDGDVPVGVGRREVDELDLLAVEESL